MSVLLGSGPSSTFSPPLPVDSLVTEDSLLFFTHEALFFLEGVVRLSAGWAAVLPSSSPFEDVPFTVVFLLLTRPAGAITGDRSPAAAAADSRSVPVAAGGSAVEEGAFATTLGARFCLSTVFLPPPGAAFARLLSSTCMAERFDLAFDIGFRFLPVSLCALSPEAAVEHSSVGFPLPPAARAGVPPPSAAVAHPREVSTPSPLAPSPLAGAFVTLLAEDLLDDNDDDDDDGCGGCGGGGGGGGCGGARCFCPCSAAPSLPPSSFP